MHTYANARLMQKGCCDCFGQLNNHRSLAELAADVGISLRCACKWLDRYRSDGSAAQADRH